MQSYELSLEFTPCFEEKIYSYRKLLLSQYFFIHLQQLCQQSTIFYHHHNKEVMRPLTVYKASAGSGKTFTLAVQYIKLLLQAEDVGEYAHILAVTFTNKATAEMKDRILSQLYGIGHGLHSSRNYFHALKEALNDEGKNYSDEEIRLLCRRALHFILHDYNRFRVQTIDAFFQTIVRGVAHELGLAANLQVEISDTEVLSKAVDRIVDRLQDDPQVFAWLMSLVRDRIDNDQRWDVTRDVKNFGRAIFNEDYLIRGEKLRTVLNDTAFMRAFITHLQEIETTGVETIKSLGARLEKAVYEANVSFADFSNGQTLCTLVERFKAGDLNVEIGPRIRGWADDPLSLVKKADQTKRQDLLEVADEVCSLLDEAINKIQSAQYMVNSARLAQAHLKPLCLLDAIDREVASINAENSRFNLAKTPILLSRMIGENDAPFIFEKIGALLHHVMIDEFQDTSRLQWKNFCVLLLESYAKGGQNLLVGDVKQSIYRWRGGDWRILGNIENEMNPAPIIRNLDTNRRSSRHIVEFNNEFFEEAVKQLSSVSLEDIESIGGNFSFSSAYADVRQQIPEDKPQDGFVSVSLLDADNYKKRDDWQPVILDELKQQIRQLHAEGLPYSEMTILVRNNSDMKPVIESFAQDSDMPAVVSDEAFLLSASPAVCALIAALRVLDDPHDAVSSYYLRSTIPSFPAEGLDSKLAMMPLYELLEALYQHLQLEKIENQDAYLFGFFDAVLDFLHTESSDIHSFLAYWDERLSRQSIPAGQVEGIRIITIHKAKGLEFHTVFMPFCCWAFERDRTTDLLWCSPQEAPYDQLQLLPITPNSKTVPNSVFACDYAESHILSRLDELNTLYVGFTRATSNLFVWAVGSKDGLSKSRRTVGDLIAAVIPDDTIVGEPMFAYDCKDDEHDNRMNLICSPLDVNMHSFPMGVSFRQSNRSQQMIASFSDDDDDSERARANHYIEIGRLLHDVLQQIETSSDIDTVLNAMEREGVISRYAPDGSYVAVRRSDVERWLARGLDNPKVASWFSGSWTLFNECSIVSVNPDTHQIDTHRPDRVMISKDGQHIVIVDFKFGHYLPAYDDQVRTYMRLISQMCPSAQVEGYLWFVYTDKVQTVNQMPSASVQLTLEF